MSPNIVLLKQVQGPLPKRHYCTEGGGEGSKWILFPADFSAYSCLVVLSVCLHENAIELEIAAH